MAAQLFQNLMEQRELAAFAGGSAWLGPLGQKVPAAAVGAAGQGHEEHQSQESVANHDGESLSKPGPGSKWKIQPGGLNVQNKSADFDF